jgi:hypothetical protein
MQTVRRSFVVMAVLAVAASLGGCFLAAAGAGAGGAIYVTERGAEAQVATPVARTLDATRQAFQEYGITETKSSNEQDGGVEKRSLEGKTSDRDVAVDLRSEGSGTHVAVVVKKSMVTWDKDFAKRILNKIVEQAK